MKKYNIHHFATASDVKSSVIERFNRTLKVHSHQTRMKRFARMIYMLSQCKDAIDNPAARIERFFTRDSRELKNLNFGVYSRRDNQSEACSSSDVITSGGRKYEKIMEDKIIVVVCGYPEPYVTTSYFYKNRNKKDLAWKKVSEEVRQSGKL